MAANTNPFDGLPFSFYAEGELARNQEIRQRFIDRFLKTYGHIPAEDSILIAENAKTLASGVVEVQLRDAHPSLSRGPTLDAIAQCIRSFGGAELIFKSIYAKELPDRECSCWIAHELAHLYLGFKDASHGRNYDEAEREVSELLVSRWGFTERDESDLRVANIVVNLGVPLNRSPI